MHDYLRSELLDRLPEAYVSFLTRTSALERMSGPLCDAVLEERGSAGMLAELARSNLLLTFFNCGSYWRGVRSSLGLARKPSSRPGRYCIRRSRVLTSTVS